MITTINNNLIRSFRPCYDPSKYIDEDESLTVKEGVEKYRGIVPAKDIIWLLCRKEFMSDRDLRLFAVWCAREALKLVDNPDPRSVAACDVAERFANGDATKEELASALAAALAAGWDDAAAAAAAAAAADAAAWAAALAATEEAAGWDDAWEKQLDKLITYF